ncbi:hypothetical protein PSMK_18630 [Phycisphaera mikurensis NBRC 102666]|uniref:Uncharacterized protein n=1 Tax=Phycisphaera mikurensis (strain NBRC 102666 / KCTC 22515 / FYK2301M01) TaxID=1142394 RepID=I0IFI4_PHYMF|nr:hypothetical protein PSMK_18630 [Phycisphaera mikurensis NBRC 102666]
MLWVHDAMLSERWLRKGEPAVFVFDEAWIRDAGLSLKRLVFMAECLEAMPGVEVRRGEVVGEVLAFAAEHGAGVVRTVDAADPRLRRQREVLAESIEVERTRPPAFVDEAVPPADLRSFSRYWKKHGRAAKRPR